MNATRLVVFDVDGTLCDSQHQIVDAMARAFAAEGWPCPPRDAVLGIVGLSLPEAFARLVPEAPATVRARLVAAYKAAYFDARAAGALAPLYDGIWALLDLLAARNDVVLGIATGKSRRGLDHLLAAHGLQGRFNTRQVADDHPSKPHPAMLHAAMADAGVGPAQTVMIGDTSYDITMGRAAGTATVAVGWGYHPADELRAAGPDRFVAAPAQIAPALDSLWQPA